jgi:divalent metal cation (Fe/Co/Zn/Cd) transporter
MSKAASQKLKLALRGFKLSFALSLAGAIIEAAAVLLSYNMILLADLSHWIIDTVLEALFVVSITYASKTYRRFPLGSLILESLLVTIAAIAIIGVYGYFFVSYFLNIPTGEVKGNYHPALAVVTVIGGILTLIVGYVQKKNFEELGLEVLKVDYKHAFIDTLAAFTATMGLITVSMTRNPGFEALFVSLLTLFVFHSVMEVLGDTIKTITGRNIEPELRLKIYRKLEGSLDKIDLKKVDARKVGSFYIVSIAVEASPHMTIRDAYKLRSRIIELVREVNEMIYHVDVFIKPTRKSWRKAEHSRS